MIGDIHMHGFKLWKLTPQVTSAYLVDKLSLGLLFALCLQSAFVKPCIFALVHKKLKPKHKCQIEAGVAALLSRLLGIDAIKMGMLGKAPLTA